MLAGVDLVVGPGEHWALLGPNGAGKSSLLSILAALRHPSRGRAEVLGAVLGQVDLRELRRRIGLAAPGPRVPAAMPVADYVLTGASQTVQPVPAGYGEAERARAAELLELVGLAGVATVAAGECSTGELARARVARALVGAPELLLLDEVFAGLDLAGREDLRETLGRLAAAHPRLASVTVAHHLEELPEALTHVALLRAGRLVAAGEAGLLADPEALSTCFARPVAAQWRAGRWQLAAVPVAGARPGRA